MKGIYEVKNTVNGSVYIGKSIDVDGRIKQHISALRGNYDSNEPLQNDYNKHGEEKFEFNIILECDEDLLPYYEFKTIEEKSKVTDVYNKNSIKLCNMYELLSKLEVERTENKDLKKSIDIIENSINEQISKINIKKEDLKLSYEDIESIRSIAQMESMFNDNKWSYDYTLISKYELNKHCITESDDFKYISSTTKNSILKKTIRYINRNYGSMIEILKEDNNLLSNIEFEQIKTKKGIEYRINVELEYSLIINKDNKYKFTTSILIK